MDNLIQPCRKYNSIFMMGFVVSFHEQIDIKEIGKVSSKLKPLFLKKRKLTNKEKETVAYKYSECSILPNIELFLSQDSLALYDADYIQWQFTQKAFVDIISTLDILREDSIKSCTLGYLDKFLIKDEIEYRHIFKANPYIPQIAFVDNMLAKYSLHIACDKIIGIDDKYIKNLSCHLSIHSDENKKDKDYPTRTWIDSSIKFERTLKFQDFLADIASITNNMHTWSNYIFQTIMSDSLLEKVGASGD